MKLMGLRYAGNCVTCGVRIEQGMQAWFDGDAPKGKKVSCTSCRPPDAQLAVEPTTNAPEALPPPTVPARTDLEKGAELEQRIAEVFAAHGYQVETNVVLEGRGGTSHEIDVLAEKADDLLTLAVGIECKAWANPIEKDVVSKFADVCYDLGIGNPLVVSLNGMRSGAVAMAEQRGVTLWGQAEIERHVGKSSVLNLQNRPMREEVGFARQLVAPEAEQLVAKQTSGTLGIGREEVVRQGSAWLPVAVVQLTLQKYGLRRTITGKVVTVPAWGIYDLIGGTFVTRLDDEPERTPVTMDGPKIDQILKPSEPGRTIEAVIAKWDKASTDSALAKYRKQMDQLGIPDMHSATVGTTQPFLYPVHIAIAQAKNGTERVIAIDAFRSRHDSGLSAECSKQIVAVRRIVGE